jgi:hypothetical protein
VRELLKRGLASDATGVAGDGARSKDFGVLGLINESHFKDGDSAE